MQLMQALPRLCPTAHSCLLRKVLLGKIVAHAKPMGVSVEAEVGSVSYANSRDHTKLELITTP